MALGPIPPAVSASAPPADRIRCPACFKQFSSNQNLVHHLEKVGHTEHEPQCGACHKHCFCFEALREHLHGRLAKKECAIEFASRGCDLCMNFLENEDALTNHRLKCQYVATLPYEKAFTAAVDNSSERAKGRGQDTAEVPCSSAVPQIGAVAFDCGMVGAGTDGSVTICARVCLVDEHENVLLHTYVKPCFPVTDFRSEITGIKAADLRNAPTLKRVRCSVKRILGNQRLLIGHDLRHDLACLRLDYPPELLRDTATYQLFVKTNGVSHKLRFLTETYLGYKIQHETIHDPYEDAVAAMRLYKRMRSRRHSGALFDLSQLSLQDVNTAERSCSSAYSCGEPTFYCWCLDSQRVSLDQVRSFSSTCGVSPPATNGVTEDKFLDTCTQSSQVS